MTPPSSPYGQGPQHGQGPAGPPPSGPYGQVPRRPDAPNLVNGATTEGILGRRGIRHPWELPLLWVGVAITIVAFALWLWATVYLVFAGVTGAQSMLDRLDEYSGIGSTLMQFYVLIGVLALMLWLGRAIQYAQPRAVGVRMSPTQFPEGYRMVVEAARHHGLRRVPDAYVMLGNGTINAFASGHGFRRFVVVYSDLFEVGGAARDPEALRFIIGHEVGHMAAGHVSYVRVLFTTLMMQVPLIGPAFSRAQEYTADNFGYSFCPQGAPGTMAVLGAGKYLNADVNVNELADRAVTERGLWLHIVNWGSSHPITTWRAHALRHRERSGKIWFRPGSPLFPGVASTPMFRGPLPSGSVFTSAYPTPDEVLEMLDAADAQRPRNLTNQFGRFPGADYSDEPSIRAVQTAMPLLSRRSDGPTPAAGPGGGAGQHPGGGSGPYPGGGPSPSSGPGPYPGSPSGPYTGGPGSSPSGPGAAPGGPGMPPGDGPGQRP
ncbi:M48 family metallopeptidase [Brachybacterium huguangmaarense]|uniref:M48 family metallopeptidase n=1 Tax=Brachybacterium huguangmaarense TaxID=1652028 RepID=A0ABY6G3R5_9MICO|nr:M48 family metallopeptidase [Brachybacterium huguangmaarense]UYG17441.1 M48 family metallopeptidase [Brachybacterium huguangmaarense]